MNKETAEYERALRDIDYLETWLKKLSKQYPNGERGLTMAGIRKKLARIQEELVVLEAGRGIAAARVRIEQNTSLSSPTKA
jgi:hypothetical protein